MKIIIVGGGRTGYHLAKHIPRSVIVESNPEKHERLNQLVGVNAVLGDGSDEEVLLKAGLKDADAIIVVTADDKINYEVASIAVEQGVRIIIARVENPDNYQKFEDLKISAILCPTTVVADYIKDLIHPKAGKEFFLKNILVPITGPQTIEEAFEEALQLSLRTDAQLILVGNKKEDLGDEEKVLSLLDVNASIELEEGDLAEAVEKHMKGADLVVVDPQEMSYFKKILKKSIIVKLLENFDTPILVSRVFKPYKKVLAVADGSDASIGIFKLAALLGEVYSATVEIISLNDSIDLSESIEGLKENGKINDFEVIHDNLEGNANVEVVKKVKSGDYDVTILPWGSQTHLKDDVVDTIIHQAPKSVLVVKG